MRPSQARNGSRSRPRVRPDQLEHIALTVFWLVLIRIVLLWLLLAKSGLRRPLGASQLSYELLNLLRPQVSKKTLEICRRELVNLLSEIFQISSFHI
jgi:hypothetical protein